MGGQSVEKTCAQRRMAIPHAYGHPRRMGQSAMVTPQAIRVRRGRGRALARQMTQWTRLYNQPMTTGSWPVPCRDLEGRLTVLSLACIFALAGAMTVHVGPSNQQRSRKTGQ